MNLSETETPGPTSKKRKVGQDDGPPKKRSPARSSDEDGADLRIVKYIRNPATVGIIDSVELQDFMCHKHLKVSFSKIVTIISGENGSGKSAVLVALAVGLGGKATTTKRGSSLKNFIQEGCRSALVRVSILNGDSSEKGAFEWDKYGKMIVVERQINSDGTGGYQLKNASGKVVSSVKEDLKRMLDHFNIQVDNPVCILPQDMSRNFLHSTSPKDKYRLFMDATELSQLSSEYSKIATRHAEIKSALTDRKASLKKLEKVAVDHEQLYKDLVHVEELKEKKEKLISDIAWAQVFAIKQQIKPLQEAVKAKEKQLLQYEDKVSECKAAREQARIKHEALSEHLQELTQEAQNRKAEKEEMQAALQRKIALLREADTGRLSLKHQMKRVKSDRQQMTTHIEQIRNEESRDRDTERRDLELRLGDVECQLQEVNGCLSMERELLDRLELASTQIMEKKHNLKLDCQHIQENLEQHCHRLHQLRKAGQDRLQVFGSNYVNLCHRIEAAMKQQRFHKKPVGPLGLHIKLCDAKWALAVEACIGREILSGFAVDNEDDKKMLESLFRSFQWRGGERQPVIVMTKFLDHVHDICPNKPNCEFPTVWDMIIVDNVIAANVLIDQRSVEGCLLIEQRKHAFQIIQKEAHRPAKALMAYTKDGDRVYPDTSFISNNVRRVFCLQQDVKEEIRAVMNEKQQCEGRRDEALRQWDTLERQLADNDKELKASKSKIQRDQQLANRLEARKSDLESALEEEEEQPDVTALQEDVRQFDMELQQLSDKLVEAEGKCSQIQAVVSHLQKKFDEHRKAVEKLLERGESLKNELDISSSDVFKRVNKYELYSSGLVKRRQELEDARSDLDNKERKFESCQQRVAKHYPEQSKTTDSVQNLESKLKSLDKRIEERAKSKDQREEIRQAYHDSIQRYKELKKKIRQLDRFQMRLDYILTLRLDRWESSRQFIEMRLSIHFASVMKKRGYPLGELVFDDKNETLELQVAVSEKAGQTKDSRALSGGERSLCTVAFILSLWEAIEVPFRCLDEFDIFMDLVMRRFVMKELITAAKHQRNRQTILLTPQDLSGFDIYGDPDVDILRLPAPKRNQAPLDFSAARGSSNSNS